MLSSDGRELNPNSEGTNANSHKKSVLVWKGTKLEEKFLKAEHDLGKEATSNQILEHMKENGITGLTRKQVSSHLQKHRKRCAKDTSLTRYESGQKHLRKLQLKENKKAAVKRSAASSFESKPAQEDCPPINNGQKRQMITQSDQFNTPNFGDGLYDAGFGSGVGAVGDSTFAGFNHGNYQFPLSFSGVNEQGSTSSLTLPSMAQRQFSLGNDEQNDNNNVDYVFDNIAGQQQFGQSADMLYKPTDYRQFQYHQQQGGEGAPNPSCHAAMNPPISANTNPLNQPNFTNFGMGSTDKVVLSNPNYDNINNYAGNQQQSGEGVLTPNFPSNPSNKTSVEANHPTSQLDDELFPEGGFAEACPILDWDDDDIASIFNDLDPILPL